MGDEEVSNVLFQLKYFIDDFIFELDGIEVYNQ